MNIEHFLIAVSDSFLELYIVIDFSFPIAVSDTFLEPYIVLDFSFPIAVSDFSRAVHCYIRFLSISRLLNIRQVK